LAAVYLPKLDELFWAVRGQGAFLNAEPIAVSQEKVMQNALIATGFPYSFYTEVDQICERLRRVLLASQGIRRMGSAAVDLAYTACGRFEGYYETGLKPWDTAAGWLLVEEAGGRVSGLGGDYGLGTHMIVASNGAIHEELLSLLRLQET
jgi:myo-inositol-1(or 4)-monophosphatase